MGLVQRTIFNPLRNTVDFLVKGAVDTKRLSVALSQTPFVGANPEVGGSTPFVLTLAHARTQVVNPAGAITVRLLRAMGGPESWLQRGWRFAVPLPPLAVDGRLTTPSSGTVKSAPAFTFGEGIEPPPGWATTSTLTASVDHDAPSKAPKRNSIVVLVPAASAGAVNQGVAVDAALRTTPGPLVWIQPVVSPTPFGCELQRPSSWTRWPA